MKKELNLTNGNNLFIFDIIVFFLLYRFENEKRLIQHDEYKTISCRRSVGHNGVCKGSGHHYRPSYSHAGHV